MERDERLWKYSHRRGIIFSASFIEKCTKYKDSIEHLVQQARSPMIPEKVNLITRGIFEAGDAFHHHETMKPAEHKIVNGVLAETEIYAEDHMIAYPIGECIILPTEELLKAGLEALAWFLEDAAFGNGPEHLLNAFIESIPPKVG
jgi:hypothetical protein